MIYKRVGGRNHVAQSCWATIGSQRHYYRSKMELNYAHYLEWLKRRGIISGWIPEPTTFYFEGIKRGTTNYKPDFMVLLSEMESKKLGRMLEYHEVKGFYDAKSKTKIKRMAKYYPEIHLKIIDNKWFKANQKLSIIVPGWCL